MTVRPNFIIEAKANKGNQRDTDMVYGEQNI